MTPRRRKLVTTPASAQLQAARRRKPPRRAEVVSVSPVSPRLISVLVTGDELDGFADAAPTSHLKVFLPAEGQDAPNLPSRRRTDARPPDGPPPVVRTYTPRRYDPATKTLEIQFLLHGTGPASEWAQRAKPGDKLAVAGPGGRFSLEPVAGHWWLAADESAIPAVGTLLEALPETDRGRRPHRGRRPGRRGRIRRPGQDHDQLAPPSPRTLRRRAAPPPALPASRKAPASGSPARRPRCATSAATS